MFKRIFVLLGLCALALNVTGCAGLLAGAAAGGLGTAYWMAGKLTDRVMANYDDTVKATQQAVKSMQLDVTEITRTDQVTQITANYPDGRKVWIDVREVPLSEYTQVEIRVGVTGDKTASNRILERIRNNVGAPQSTQDQGQDSQMRIQDEPMMDEQMQMDDQMNEETDNQL